MIAEAGSEEQKATLASGDIAPATAHSRRVALTGRQLAGPRTVSDAAPAYGRTTDFVPDAHVADT